MPGKPPPRQDHSDPPARAMLPLYAALRDRLKNDILSGRRRPGDKLPSENEFTQTLGVSRITVRQALGDLRNEGLVVKTHGKGSFVAMPPVAQDLTRLRGLAESLTGVGRTVHTRVLSIGPKHASPPIATAFGLSKSDLVIELRTLRYLNRKPLALNRSYLPQDIGSRLIKADFANRDILSMLEGDLGVAIGHAEVSIGAANAKPGEARLLGVADGTALVQVRRLVFTSTSRPVHLEQSVYRSDLFSYTLTLERDGH